MAIDPSAKPGIEQEKPVKQTNILIKLVILKKKQAAEKTKKKTNK